MSAGKSQSSTPVSTTRSPAKPGKSSGCPLFSSCLLNISALRWSPLVCVSVRIVMASTLVPAVPVSYGLHYHLTGLGCLFQFPMSVCSRHHLKCLTSFHSLNTPHDLRTQASAAMFRIQLFLIRKREDPRPPKNLNTFSFLRILECKSRSTIGSSHWMMSNKALWTRIVFQIVERNWLVDYGGKMSEWWLAFLTKI